MVKRNKTLSTGTTGAWRRTHVTTTAETHTAGHVEVMGARVEFMKDGTGDPVFVFHHSIGSSGWIGRVARI